MHIHSSAEQLEIARGAGESEHMFNVFSRAQVISAGIELSVVQSAVGCCVDRVSPGVFAIVELCSHARHRRIQYLIDDPALVTARAPAGGASGPPISSSVTPWERARQLHIGRLGCSVRLRDDDVISHVSAALVHGLPVLGRTFPRIEVSNPRSHGVTAGLRRRQREVPAGEVQCDASTFGLPVTTRVRVAADLIRDGGWQAGIMAAEAWLSSPGRRATGTSERFPLPAAVRDRRKAELRELVDRLPGTRSAKRMSTLLGYCSGLSESPAEALAVLGLHHVGIHDFEQQAELHHRDGTYLGRVDFLIRRLNLVIEVDGMGKYLTQPAERLVDVEVFKQEKRRESEIRALGLHVLRLEWKDVVDPAAFARALRRAGVIR